MRIPRSSKHVHNGITIRGRPAGESIEGEGEDHPNGAIYPCTSTLATQRTMTDILFAPTETKIVFFLPPLVRVNGQRLPTVFASYNTPPPTQNEFVTQATTTFHEK